MKIIPERDDLAGRAGREQLDLRQCQRLAGGCMAAEHLALVHADA
ncbi:hypothetical protein ACVW0I_003085 [Bradyrhizobium sp. LM6.11]